MTLQELKRLRPPMQAPEAYDKMRFLEQCRDRSVRISILRLALGPLGNLAPDARRVYEAQLKKELA